MRGSRFKNAEHVSVEVENSIKKQNENFLTCTPEHVRQCEKCITFCAAHVKKHLLQHWRS